MNDGFPPLTLAPPESRQRRKEEGRRAPLSPEILARRHEIAQVLKVKIDRLSHHLKSMSDAERRAVFYKLEHENPVNPLATLSGTDLKPISQPSPEVVYAVPKKDTLNRLSQKVDEFATAPVKKQHVPNEWLAQLKDIQEADPKDRLSADLRKRYAALVKSGSLICEIEFLSLKQGSNQQKEEIEGWLEDLEDVFGSGVKGTLFEHELMPPTCRAVIRCTGAMFQRIVEEPLWIERIRWIESRPKFQTFKEVLDTFKVQDLAPIASPAQDAPIVCIVDSGVTVGNPFLAPVVQPHLTKSFLKQQPNNPNDEHGHGSAVASLTAYYGLNLATGAQNQPRLWIASARILNANNQIEDERLFSKVLEEVVTHFVKKRIRIFCLAIGDDRRIWGDSSRRILPRTSWVARRIDQLSREHDIVFVTCTGNIDLSDLSNFEKDGKAYPKYLADDTAQLLDPGQAATALTVGSVAPGTKIVLAKDTKAIALRNQPSPFTRSGPGIRREIKPEIVEYGGNLAYDSAIARIRENRGLQVAAASKQLSPAVSFWTGTSFAAPRVAHRLALIDQDLRSLGISPSASLLRAFLVNSAAHREENGELSDIRRAFSGKDRQDQLHMLLGYGLPDHDRATGCDDYSVVAYFQGEIKPDHVMFFDIPVPAQLAKSNDQRRLTVTVAHAPEVQRWGLERYFGVDLKWRMFRGDKSRDEIVDAMSEPVDESDEQTFADLFMEDGDDTTLPKELPFKPTFQKRSRGTMQHAAYEWSQHRKEYSDGHYTLAIAAYKRWTKKVKNVPIAVVVRLEDLGRRIPIYAHVQTSIEVEI
jgi:hypothetical protein